LEVLYPLESEDGQGESRSASLDEMYRPIIQSDYVPSLCEAMCELMKRLKSKDIAALIMPPTDPHKLPKCDTTEINPLEDTDEIVPPGHVQTSLLNALASLCYLMKIPSGMQILTQHNQAILNVLLPMFQKFNVCTERIAGPDRLDYFALALELVGHCHSQLDRVLPSAIAIPAYVAMWLTKNEVDKSRGDEELTARNHVVTLRNGETVETETSPFVLSYYNYVTDMEEKFGSAEVQRTVEDTCNKELSNFHERAKAKALQLQRVMQPTSSS